MLLTTARILLVSAAASAIALAGCSKAPAPADEAPVALQSGEYRIDFRNNGVAMNMTVAMAERAPSNEVKQPGGIKEKGICVSGDDDAAKIAQLVHQGDNSGYCSLVQGERKGNAVSGKLSCPMVGSTEYAGHLTATSLSVEGTMTVPAAVAPGGTDNSYPIKITAERIGDCA